MAGVRTLKTLTESFWRDEYEVSSADIDLITGQILEAARPQRLGLLASTVIMRRMQAEKEAATRQAKSGQLYQPKGHYEVGQMVAFSALDFETGRVVGVRQGENPKYSNFGVIRVAFDRDSSEREFAADLDVPHPLNAPIEELVVSIDSSVSEADLVRAFEHYVALKLEPILEGAPEFVRFNGAWFLRDLLPEVHVGHLNIAEAMIYEAGHPLPAREMLAELGLPVTGSREAQLFALNRALREDNRFDNVSMRDEPIWFLRALVPEAVYQRPATLVPAFKAQGGEYIGLTMLDMVEEIGDELDDVDAAVLREGSSVRFELNFPHLYAGTMPASQRLLRIMPANAQRYYPITLIDSRNKQRFDAWVVPDDRYLCGLKEWYTSAGVCVGAEVTITSTDEPMTFGIAVVPVRSRRSEWVRSVTVAEGDLVLQMQRASVEVRADRNMLIDVPNGDEIASLMAQAAKAQLSLTATVRTAFTQLAKLGAGGAVHAKSLYSAANLLRRTGAVPVFAELTRRACYDPVGDGLWVYNPDLEGAAYRDPAEMRERPLSTRENTARDQAIQYLGR